MKRPWFSHTAATVTVALTLPMAAAPAVAATLSPSDPVGREHWVNPQLRTLDSESTATLALDAVSASVGLGEQVSMKLRATAPKDLAGEGFALRVSRAGAVESISAARVALAQDPSAFTVSSPLVTLAGQLSAGEPRILTHTVSTTGLEGLNITKPGAYPVQVELVHRDTRAVVRTERFLLGVGLDSRFADTEGMAGETAAPAVETPMTVLIPVAAPVDRLGGETGEAPERAPLILKSEQLASLVAPSGRLSALIDAYSEAAYNSATLASASCLAIDPELVDTVRRMAQDGYVVASTRPSAVSQNLRLRDSWDQDEQTRDEVPGIGQQDAQLWLDKLASIAQDSCVVATPWAQADLDAVASTGNPRLLTQAVDAGPAILTEVLQANPVENVLLPPNGYLTETTAAALAQLGVPRTALVASNSVWNAPTVDRFAHLDTGISAVTYDASVAATIAESTEEPTTVGYGNYLTRYDQSLDSPVARTASATTAVQWTVATSTDPLLITLPETLGTTDAELGQWLGTTTALLESPLARPANLQEYLAPNSQQRTDLQAAVSAAAGQAPDATSAYGSPFMDPTGFAEAEIHQAATMAGGVQAFSTLMVADPVIALSPEGFIAPLLQDVVRSLSHYGRRSMGTYDAAMNTTSALLDQGDAVLGELRGSVSLVPPGHVFTRTSDASPILIAARNGLPLPVDARVMFAGDNRTIIHVPEHLIIPAKGSITVSLTADLPEENTASTVQLWLATTAGESISEPVDISVTTRNLGWGQTVVIAMGLILTLALGIRLARKDRIRRAASPLTRWMARHRNPHSS